MTRAIDRLVICGAEGERAPPEDCWWKMVFAALQPPVSVEEPADDGEGTVWRYRKVPPSGAQDRAEGPCRASADARPPWLDRDLGAEAPLLRLVSPSSAYDEAMRRRAPSPAAAPRATRRVPAAC